MDDEPAGGTESGTDRDTPDWTDLFDRAARYDVDEPAVREALARRREHDDE